MNKLPALLLIFLTAGLPGCATSPEPRYFRLTPEAAPARAASTRAVIIGPFQLAEYLDRPQIVSRDSANQVIVAEYERWAEPLDSNFQEVVAANVSSLLGSDHVLEFPAQTILKPDSRVSGRVSRMDVNNEGLAVLEVQWGVLNADGSVAQEGRRSRYEANAADGSYAARVRAINSTVARFSEDIAAVLK